MLHVGEKFQTIYLWTSKVNKLPVFDDLEIKFLVHVVLEIKQEMNKMTPGKIEVKQLIDLYTDDVVLLSKSEIHKRPGVKFVITK